MVPEPVAIDPDADDVSVAIDILSGPFARLPGACNHREKSRMSVRHRMRSIENGEP